MSDGTTTPAGETPEQAIKPTGVVPCGMCGAAPAAGYVDAYGDWCAAGPDALPICSDCRADLHWRELLEHKAGAPRRRPDFLSVAQPPAGLGFWARQRWADGCADGAVYPEDRGM